MSNVELVQQSLERFVRTGELVWDVTDPEVVIVDHDIMDGSEYRGHEGVQRWLGDWSSAWSHFTMEPEEVIDAGDSVVVIVRMKATGAASGIEIERRDGIVYRVYAGRIIRLDYFNSAEQALAAAGLSA